MTALKVLFAIAAVFCGILAWIVAGGQFNIPCIGTHSLQTPKQALDKGIDVAMKYHRDFFAKLGIGSPAELLAKYPKCCNVGHPYKDKSTWQLDIKAISPCTTKSVTITVLMNRCGDHDPPFDNSFIDMCYKTWSTAAHHRHYDKTDHRHLQAVRGGGGRRR